MSGPPIYLNAKQLQAALPWSALLKSLKKSFQQDCQMPLRHHHAIQVPGSETATLLLMPAWIEGQYLGVKLANVFPGNRHQQLPSISASYLLSSGTSGETLAIMDGGELTARRTAAASVLAARYLAPKTAQHHLMVGTGRLSSNLIQAYASQLDLHTFSLWGRNQAHCEQTAGQLKELGIAVNIVPVDGLNKAVAAADIISSATLSHQPLIKGQYLQPGTHVDLVGSFTPAMREADDDVIRKAKVFVDTREGALKESGDLVMPLQTGVLQTRDIQADLFALCRKQHAGRQNEQDITVFKSVGAACEDLAAAVLAYQTVLASDDKGNAKIGVWDASE